MNANEFNEALEPVTASLDIQIGKFPRDVESLTDAEHETILTILDGLVLSLESIVNQSLDSDAWRPMLKDAAVTLSESLKLVRNYPGGERTPKMITIGSLLNAKYCLLMSRLVTGIVNQKELYGCR